MNNPPLDKASTDSTESAKIGLASEEHSTRMEGGSSGTHRDANGGGGGDNLAHHEESGHHDPRRRRIYLGLFGLSLASALTGFALLVVWMFNYRPVTGVGLSSAAQLANLHPLMMYLFMVSLNMYAVLIYRTHYCLPKNQLKWTHAIISGGNMVMSLLGVFAMLKSHWLSGTPNFYSLHSWIGTLTNAFYVTQFLVGFVAFLRPGLAQHRRASLMPWHKLAGASLLVLASTAAITGIAELVIFQDSEKLYSKFAPITFIANLAGMSVILMAAVSLYLLTAPQYVRPRLPEEEPLKR